MLAAGVEAGGALATARRRARAAFPRRKPSLVGASANVCGSGSSVDRPHGPRAGSGAVRRGGGGCGGDGSSSSSEDVAGGGGGGGPRRRAGERGGGGGEWGSATPGFGSR
ncbi:hypothetical protein R5R35_012781 [Gryllus longicercus]|uniref:Uncharacterized protein n=1 Tax=Gryllus longicercus TaxID=2509291 RepID=A0AAN9VI67_9ORTH